MTTSTRIEVPPTPAFDLPPNVALKARFCAHLFAPDIGTPEEIRDRLTSCQVYAPEAFGWYPGNEIHYNHIANGRSIEPLNDKSTIGQSIERADAIMSSIRDYGRYFRVLFLDIPENSPACLRVRNANRRLDAAYKCMLPFDEMLDQLAGAVIEQGLAQIMREHEILVGLAAKVERARKESAKLRRCKPLKLLWEIGPWHLGMSSEIRSRQQKLQVGGFTYDEELQLGTDKSFNVDFAASLRRGEMPDRLLLARLRAEYRLFQTVPRMPEDTSGVQLERVRSIIAPMTFADLRELYESERRKQ